MDWRAHSAIGAVFSAGAAWLLGSDGFVQLVFFAFFGALAALLPDLDLDQSKGKRILDSSVVALALILAFLYACGGRICVPGIGGAIDAAILFLIVVGAYFVFFRLFKPRHRGITHTLVACFVFGVLVYLAAGLVPAVCGFSAYFSHLLADRQVKLV